MTPRGSPRKVAAQDANGDSPSSNKRSHADMARQHEISDGSRGASPPDYGIDDDEDFARTIPSPDLHRPDVTSPPVRSASKNRHDSKSMRSPATSDENLGAQTEPSRHEEDTENEDASQDESVDPGESLESFDWDDLETRYHDMVRQKSKEEEALRAEFDVLCQVMLSVPCRSCSFSPSILTSHTVL